MSKDPMTTMDDILTIEGTNYVLEGVHSSHASRPIVSRINSLSHLPEGWWSGQGVPATDAAVRTARRIALLNGSPEVRTNAFPVPDGGVIVKFYRMEYVVEVNVSADGAISYSVQEGLGADFKVLAEDEGAVPDSLIELIVSALSYGCDLSGFFPLTPTTLMPVASTGPRSPLFGEPFQYSIVNAR